MILVKRGFIILLCVFLCLNSCKENNEYQFTGKSLGVLIVYFDPGISQQRVEEVLDAAKDINAQWIRIGLIWGLANPAPDNYDFQTFDMILSCAQERDLSVFPVIMFTPQWLSSQPDSADFYLYPPTDEQVGESAQTGYDYLFVFAKTIATRYKENIEFWELWNEPDMEVFLKNPDTADNTTADNYAKMLAYFYQGIKAGNPEAKVVLGGLADQPAEPTCNSQFFSQILTDTMFPAANYFDIHNIHTNFRSIDEIKAQIQQNRTLLNQYNAADKKIWITETSYTPVEKFQIVQGYQDGEKSFNRYVREVLTAELQSEAEVVFWAALHDYIPETPETDPYKYSGLFTYDLVIKQAGKEFKKIASNINNY